MAWWYRKFIYTCCLRNLYNDMFLYFNNEMKNEIYVMCIIYMCIKNVCEKSDFLRFIYVLRDL